MLGIVERNPVDVRLSSILLEVALLWSISKVVTFCFSAKEDILWSRPEDSISIACNLLGEKDVVNMLLA